MNINDVEIGMTVKSPWKEGGRYVKGKVVSKNPATKMVTLHEPMPTVNGKRQPGINVMTYHVSELRK